MRFHLNDILNHNLTYKYIVFHCITDYKSIWLTHIWVRQRCNNFEYSNHLNFFLLTTWSLASNWPYFKTKVLRTPLAVAIPSERLIVFERIFFGLPKFYFLNWSYKNQDLIVKILLSSKNFFNWLREVRTWVEKGAYEI